VNFGIEKGSFSLGRQRRQNEFICKVTVYLLGIKLAFSWRLDISSCSKAIMTQLDPERSKTLFVYAFVKKGFTASSTHSIDSDIFGVSIGFGLSYQLQSWL
jgi:hypothetical protein